MVPGKTCSKCGAYKASRLFYKRARSYDGLTSACAECLRVDMRLSRQRHLAERRAADRARHAHPDRRETVRMAAAVFRAEQPERVVANRLRYRADNLEVVRAAEKVSAHRRRAAKAGVRSERVPIAWLRLLLAAGCEYCGGPGEHVEHMVPLSRGGSHTYRNLTGACARCNLSKGTKIYPDEWPVH